MDSFSGDLSIACSSNFSQNLSGFSPNLGFRLMGRGGTLSSTSSSSLILDSKRGELVEAPLRSAKKGIGEEEKAIAALKSHSEAEKRRRERINAHLMTLRSIVPRTDKMDKASLLAEVINHVKELKRNATETSKGCSVPTDFDEVRVEPDGDGINKESFCIKASLCCEDRPDLLSDINQMIQGLHLKTLRAEISTLGGRVKNVFVISCEGHIDDTERRVFASSVHQALKAVLDRVSSPEFSPTSTLCNKRRKFSSFDSSSSSS